MISKEDILKQIREDIEWALWLSPNNNYFSKVAIVECDDNEFSLDISEIDINHRDIFANKFLETMRSKSYKDNDFDISDINNGYIYINFFKIYMEWL